MLRRLLLTLCILTMAMYVFASCTQTGPCNPNPCLNGGTCADIGDVAVCTCVGGYSGDTCEHPPEPCNPNPCFNGGTCLDVGGVADCTCIDGYSGDTCDVPPEPCYGVDCGEHGSCSDGICICTDEYTGDSCEHPPDPCNPNPCQNGGICTDLIADYECACIGGYYGDNCEISPIPFNEIAADRLDPTGCETYIGAHPIYPGELLCCSNATPPNVAPECNPAHDTPDIPCVVEYEFCDDGSAMKAYSPNPITGVPGHLVSNSGTWTVDPGTGELQILTTAFSMDEAWFMETTETYPQAFTYEEGAKLDLYSSPSVTIDEFGIGDYHGEVTSLTFVDGLWSSILDAVITTDVTVTGTGYVSTLVENIVCNPSGSMFCSITPTGMTTTITSGTHTQPIDLYVTPTGDKMYQTSEARTLVFERQPDPCSGIECGDYGSCSDGICVCTDGYTGDTCEEYDNFVVNFPDPNLEAAVRDAISKPSGDILFYDLQTMTILNAEDLSISNISGLEYCTNLIDLNLYSNQIIDISPLSGLVNLTDLRLGINQITDISSLSGLVNLSWLSLSGNQITDISPLSGLVNLTFLYLGSNQITDAFDFSPLNTLESLAYLSLANNQITDISPLSGLTQLVNLQLHNNQIVDISPLSGLVNLTFLTLSTNQITDISPLAGASNMYNLDLEKNQIIDISPLAGLVNLAYLYLGDNQITDISPVVGNTGIDSGDYVSLSGNPLNENSCTTLIPILEARGVDVRSYSACP